MIGLVDGNNFFVSCELVFAPKLRGRPVAVLSNNDGCCVSRSNELKALGVAMGTPYFQLKDREAKENDSCGIVFRSSNYELYGDMSRRLIMILRDAAARVEQYSIDEAFIWPPTSVSADLLGYGKKLRKKILQWIGIPCGVGFAPTKTLAKIANHIGKKQVDGVFVMPEDTSEILSKLPVGEVWGVGRRLESKLKAERIFSAQDLRDADEGVVRAVGGVTLARVAMELRGVPCVKDADYDESPESITCSRSFGTPVDDLESLSTSIASFAARAAIKLRRHGMLAGGCNIYAQYGSALDDTWTSWTVVFDRPTDATNEMLNAIGKCVPKMYVPNVKYRKSGVVFFGLEKAGTAQQLDLFNKQEPSRQSELFKAVDRLNHTLGGIKVFSAAEGLGEKKWQMHRGLISRRYTTSWDELLNVV